MTTQEKVREFRRVVESFPHFLASNVWIADGGGTRFVPWSWQVRLVRFWKERRFSRQRDALLPKRARDRMLRRLEAMIILSNDSRPFVVGGGGDVLRPDEDVVAIGFGGAMAHSAALALMRHTELPAEAIVREALAIAGSLCVYTNDQLTVEVLGSASE